MPTALGTWRLRSSRAHSDRKPAVEVQQCPLRAEVGEERRVGKAEVDMEVEAEVVEGGGRGGGGGGGEGGGAGTAVIESNNPHLGGGALLDACLTSVL